MNCALIRGSDYLSDEERQWFLSSCLPANTPVPAATPAPVGPGFVPPTQPPTGPGAQATATPAATTCLPRSPNDSIRVISITPALAQPLPPNGSSRIRVEFEYTVESYPRADLYLETTNSRDFPRYSGFGIPQAHLLQRGTATVVAEGQVPVPASGGWVDVLVSVYAPFPCGNVTLGRLTIGRYAVQ